MVLYDSGRYPVLIDDRYVKTLESAQGIQLKFLALRGTQVYGYSNAVSNYNFTAFFKPTAQGWHYKKINDRELSYSIRLYDFEYAIARCRAYVASLTKIPSILFRTDEEKEEIDRIPFDDRKDYLFGAVTETLSSDYIWDSGCLGEHRDKLKEEITVGGCFDFYFSKAYGAACNFQRRESVKANQYMQCFLSYAAAKWVLEQQSIPEMNLQKALQTDIPDVYRKFLEGIWGRQMEIGRKMKAKYLGTDVTPISYDRPKVEVPANSEFNSWLISRLEEMAEKAGGLDIAATVKDNFHLLLWRE